MYRSTGDADDVPDGLVTVTSTVPVPAGATAVIRSLELMTKLVALTAPKRTAVAVLKLPPAMVTVVPPAAGPDVGEIEATTGVCALAAATEPNSAAAIRTRPHPARRAIAVDGNLLRSSDARRGAAKRKRVRAKFAIGNKGNPRRVGPQQGRRISQKYGIVVVRDSAGTSRNLCAHLLFVTRRCWAATPLHNLRRR